MEVLWIIIVGALVAINCSLIGTYLILRKMAMMGDAISHAVLPGIVTAFMLTGSRAPFIMLIGASIMGIITTFLITFFHKKAQLKFDTSIGINFTWLFALGIILISLFTGKIDLDQDCVLYGEIAYVPFDMWVTKSGLNLGPRPIYLLGSVLFFNLCFILLNYRTLYITTFDPKFSAVLGIRTALWHYLLMGAVSITTIASFEAVGAIVVVALLVVPPATAYLLTQQLKSMLWIAAFIGIIVAITGYFLSTWIDGSISGAMATVASILFFIVFLIIQYSSNHRKLQLS